MKYIFLILFLFFTGTIINAQLPKVASGKIERVSNFKSSYVVPRNIDVWLPEGYDNSKKYAVLYMHDGQMLYDSATTWNHLEWQVDEVMGDLLKKHKIKDCIVVGIWHDDTLRHPEYFPQKPFESLPDSIQHQLYNSTRPNGFNVFKHKVVSDNYLKFIVKELKPYIDHHYATLKDKSNTFIAGSSMGGLISMYAICEYPNVFGGAACMSTHWPGIFTVENNPIPGAFLRYLKSHLPNPKDHFIYFDYGNATLDSMYQPFQLKADAIMKAKGYTAKHWMTKFYPGENHSEIAWSKRLHVPLEFLMGRK